MRLNATPPPHYHFSVIFYKLNDKIKPFFLFWIDNYNFNIVKKEV